MNVTCPSCAAEVGEACKSVINGKPLADRIHLTRKLAAKADAEQEQDAEPICHCQWLGFGTPPHAPTGFCPPGASA